MKKEIVDKISLLEISLHPLHVSWAYTSTCNDFFVRSKVVCNITCYAFLSLSERHNPRFTHSYM